MFADLPRGRCQEPTPRHDWTVFDHDLGLMDEPGAIEARRDLLLEDVELGQPSLFGIV